MTQKLLLEMHFMPPFDFLNRTVILETKDDYFKELERLTSSEMKYLIKTEVKEWE